MIPIRNLKRLATRLILFGSVFIFGGLIMSFYIDGSSNNHDGDTHEDNLNRRHDHMQPNINVNVKDDVKESQRANDNVLRFENSINNNGAKAVNKEPLVPPRKFIVQSNEEHVDVESHINKIPTRMVKHKDNIINGDGVKDSERNGVNKVNGINGEHRKNDDEEEEVAQIGVPNDPQKPEVAASPGRLKESENISFAPIDVLLEEDDWHIRFSVPHALCNVGLIGSRCHH